MVSRGEETKEPCRGAGAIQGTFYLPPAGVYACLLSVAFLKGAIWKMNGPDSCSLLEGGWGSGSSPPGCKRGDHQLTALSNCQVKGADSKPAAPAFLPVGKRLGKGLRLFAMETNQAPGLCVWKEQPSALNYNVPPCAAQQSGDALQGTSIPSLPAAFQSAADVA